MADERHEPQTIDYLPVAHAAGLDAEQLRAIEQLFSVHDSTDPFAAELRVYSACERIGQGRGSMEAVYRLLEHRSHLEDEIRTAFAGVTREDGRSWSEGWAIDDCASEEKCRAARESDRERSWEQLIDDPNWYHDNGPWSFLDAIGFRYYLAPAMVREARDGAIGSFAFYLCYTICEEELRALLTPAQSTAIQHFLQYILEVMAAFQWRDADDPTVRQLAEKWNVTTT